MLDALKFPITATNLTGGSFRQVRQELAGVRGALAGINDHALRVGRSMRNIGAGLTAGVTAPLALLGRQSVELYDTQLKAETAVRQALASTGGVAGKSAEGLFEYASGLQAITTYGDEDILRNVTAPLLTFTKIQGDTFDRAQVATLDMATLLKTDLKSAAIQVGKALNDPVKGVSSLGEAGVQFSDDQKEMIKSLVETGDVAAAQAIILKELETQFKGQAAAAAKTPLGQWTQLSNLIGDVKEQLGEQIVPFLTPLVESVKQGVVWFGALDPEVKKNIVVFGGLAAAAGPVIASLGLVAMAVGALASPIGVALVGVAALGAGAAYVASHWGEVEQNFPRLAAAVEGFGGVSSRAGEAIASSLGGAGQKVMAGFDALLNGQIISALSNFGGAARDLALMPFRALDQALGGLTGKVQAWGTQFVGALQSGWSQVRTITVQWVSDFATVGGDLLAALIAGVENAYVAARDYFSQLGARIVEGFVAGIKGQRGTIVGAGKWLVDKVTGTVKDEAEIRSPSRLFARLGGYMSEGLAVGITDGSGAVDTAVRGLVDKASEISEGFGAMTGQVGGFMQTLGSSLGSALSGARSWRDALVSVLQSVSQSLAASIQKSLGGAGGGFWGGLVSSLFGGLLGNANGNAFSGGKVTAFAKGGVVGSPTLFGMAGGTGLMGEAGPEAILPLSRGRGGRLGVVAQSAPQAVPIEVHVAPSPYFDVRVAQVSSVGDARAAMAQQRALPGMIGSMQARGTK